MHPRSLSPIDQYPLSKSIVTPQHSRHLSRLKQIQQTKRYHQLALDSFPFGKQGIKLSQYVSNKLNDKEQEQNARILEEFRRKAVEDKFNNRHVMNNNRTRERYITENMMPGITLNPSMVTDLRPELKTYLNPAQLQYNHDINSYRIRQQLPPYTQPTSNYQTIQPTQNLYNSRRPVPVYKQPVQLSQISNPSQIYQYPRKVTLSTQCQTQEIRSTPKENYQEMIESEIRNYSRMKKQKKREVKRIDKLERMLHDLNSQIKENSKYLKNVIESTPKNKPKRRIHTVNDISHTSSRNTSNHQSTKSIIKYPLPVIRASSPNPQLQNWQLNNSILYDTTQQSFKPSNPKARPKVQYSRNFTKSFENSRSVENFVNLEKSSILQRKENKVGEGTQKIGGIEKIREHLKLLKKHSVRLETINGYSLVQ